MRHLPPAARLFVLATLTVGTALLIWGLGQIRLEDVPLLAVLTALGAAVQASRLSSHSRNSTYHLGLLAYGFAFVRFGAPGLMAVILVAHLAEWVRYRSLGYVQGFKTTQLAIAAWVIVAIQAQIRGMFDPLVADGLAIPAGSLAFTALNHVFIGLSLWWSDRQSLGESDVFDPASLAIDFMLFAIGATSGYLWAINPFAAGLPLLPVALIGAAVRLPALQRQVRTDAKTQLFTAAHFTEALERELTRAHRFNHPLTVVMADVDRFRDLNNQYGHLAGDAALRSVAGILKTLADEFDLVARFGGDEFVILLSETTPEQALPRIEAIRTAIAATPISAPTCPDLLHVTMSFGIAGRAATAQSAEELIHAADQAMYQAKTEGRNRTCYHVAGVAHMAPAVVTPAEVTSETTGASIPEPTPQPPVTPSTTVSVPATHLKPRPAWLLPIYIGTLAASAALLSGWLLPGAVPSDWLGLALFVAMVGLAEGLALEIYVRDSSISTSAAAAIAGAILFGPLGAVLLGTTIAAVAWVKNRSPISRLLFNASNHTLAGFLALALYRAAAFIVPLEPAIIHVIGSVLAGFGNFLSTTVLVSIAIDLNTGQSFTRIWAQRFRWLAPYYGALGALAFVLVMAFQVAGWIGVVISVVPLLMLRYSQTQYISHTKAMVTELQASFAESQHRAEEVLALNEEMLVALSQAIDLRDPDVAGHSQQVARYAVLIAEELGLTVERIELVRRAGLLHDIGKLGVPESVLFKPARLTAREHDVIKAHATLGADIVANVRSLQALGPAIRHHHERYEGGGYPAGLQGADIPLEARILSVADTVEAMASDRPYRRASHPTAIVAEVQSQSGRQFDPVIVAAFVRVVEHHGESVIVNSVRSHAPESAYVHSAPLWGLTPATA